MIDKQRLSEVVESCLEGTPMFVTEIAVSPDNNIRVEIDSDESVDIDACAAITRAIGDAFDRDVEDYELEVGSAGITSPLRLPRQYAKYVGKDLEVLTADRKWVTRLQGAYGAMYGQLAQSFGGMYNVHRQFSVVRDTDEAGSLVMDIREVLRLSPRAKFLIQRGMEDVSSLLR